MFNFSFKVLRLINQSIETMFSINQTINPNYSTLLHFEKFLTSPKTVKFIISNRSIIFDEADPF